MHMQLGGHFRFKLSSHGEINAEIKEYIHKKFKIVRQIERVREKENSGMQRARRRNPHRRDVFMRLSSMAF
jgi:hypothetical protein